MDKHDFHIICQESWETFDNASQMDERIIDLIWQKLNKGE